MLKLIFLSTCLLNFSMKFTGFYPLGGLFVTALFYLSIFKVFSLSFIGFGTDGLGGIAGCFIAFGGGGSCLGVDCSSSARTMVWSIISSI